MARGYCRAEPSPQLRPAHLSRPCASYRAILPAERSAISGVRVDSESALTNPKLASFPVGCCTAQPWSPLSDAKLYFGDNLDILRGKIKDESIDLVYLDAPFNSSANYNVLFRAPSGEASEAQAGAFRDTWEWGESARDAFEDVIAANGDVALVLSGLGRMP